LSEIRPENPPEKGQATLELLLVLFIIIPLLFGGFELVRAISIRHSLDSGAFLAARAISLNPNDIAYAQSVVSSTVSKNILSGGATENFVPGYVTWGACPNGHVLGCRFVYTASLDYTPWIPLVGGQKVTIEIQHHGIVELIN
jgi:Flp pilus assembly protein TadG